MLDLLVLRYVTAVMGNMGSSRVKYAIGKPSAAAIALASFSLKTIKPFCSLLSFDWEM